MKDKRKFNKPYSVLIAIMIYTIAFGFIVDTPKEIYNGLIAIIQSNAVLITDYTVVGGVGATLVNAGVCGLIVIYIFYKQDLKINGSLIMAIWLLIGFCFFGKNLINILPVIVGGYLFAKYKKEPFQRYSLATIMATTLAPVVSEAVYLFGGSRTFSGWLVGVILGIFIGFIMSPIAANSMKTHNGYNLYNVGFAGGIIGILFANLAGVIGKPVATNNYWGENSTELTVYLVILLVALLIYGLKKGENNKHNMKMIQKSSGRLVTDFFMMYNETVYVNMAVIGFFSLLVMYIIKAPINGPTIAGIFTIVGFGTFGKHIKNITPVMLGALVMGYIIDPTLTTPSIILGILFASGLAPIAGTFGKIDGFIAGVIHIIIVSNIVHIHNGLNLYNNGLAAGITAMIFVPLITTFRKDEFN